MLLQSSALNVTTNTVTNDPSTAATNIQNAVNDGSLQAQLTPLGLSIVPGSLNTANVSMPKHRAVRITVAYLDSLLLQLLHMGRWKLSVHRSQMAQTAVSLLTPAEPDMCNPSSAALRYAMLATPCSYTGLEMNVII